MNRTYGKAFVVAALASILAPAPAAAQRKERKEAPPAPLPMQPVAFPGFTERTLSNGAQVIVVENHEQPVVTISLRIRSGWKNDPAGRSGVASLTAALLDKGTTTRTAEQIAESIDFVGGSLSASAGSDWISVGASTLTEFLDTALVLMSDVVRNPTFPAEELETERTRTLSALQANLGQPQYLAQVRFMREIYGDHPYGASETPESIRAITRDDLVAFHRAHFRPGNALFVVAGDVRPDDIVRRLEAHFAGWSGGASTKASLPAPPQRSAREIVFVHKPGAVQAVIRLGHLLPPATHQDWVLLDVAQQILGGGTTGWLFQTLRQEKGYTYGAYSGVAKRPEPGYITAAAEVRNEVADSALAEIFRLFDKLRDEPLASHDLQVAKDFMTGSFPLEIETPQDVAGQVADARLLGLPNDYLARYRDRVAAVSAEAVQRAAREHIRPDRAVVVVVGDATQILDKVSGFGPVRLYDANGRALDRADLEVRGADVSFDGSSIQPGTRVYDLKFQGNAMGEITMTTARENVDGADVVRATSAMSGMAGTMSQEVVFEAATFRPISSTMRQQAGPMTISVDLRVDGGKVVGTLDAAGQSREIAVDLVPGLLLPGMDEYAIQVAELKENATFTAPMINAQSGTVTSVQYRVVGESRVAVAAGEFDAYEVEATGGPMAMRLFVRKAAPHILLKQEMAGQPVAIELKELK
jgi:zinc protease